MKTRTLVSLVSFNDNQGTMNPMYMGLNRGICSRDWMEGDVQVLDEEHAKEVHQQGTDAEPQEEQKGDGMGAETPVQVTLLRLKRLRFHDDT